LGKQRYKKARDIRSLAMKTQLGLVKISRVDNKTNEYELIAVRKPVEVDLQKDDENDCKSSL